MIRTILVLALLVAAGVGFARLTHTGTDVSDEVTDLSARETANENTVRARVRITLSGPTGFIELKSGDMTVALSQVGTGASDFSGTVEISRENPILFLEVRCIPLRTDGSKHFAKLVVEAVGKKTFTHVFDAEGDIDDFVELPF